MADPKRHGRFGWNFGTRISKQFLESWYKFHPGSYGSNSSNSMFCLKILYGCIRNQGWARSRARVRIVVSVILSVVEACPTAPRLSALPVLSILLVADLVLLCWPTRVAKCYPAGPSRASLNLDKVFEDAKIWTAVLMICFIIFFRDLQRKDDWVKKSSKSTKKQESLKFTHMQFTHVKTSTWRLSGKWVKNDPIGHKSPKDYYGNRCRMLFNVLIDLAPTLSSLHAGLRLWPHSSKKNPPFFNNRNWFRM